MTAAEHAEDGMKKKVLYYLTALFFVTAMGLAEHQPAWGAWGSSNQLLTPIDDFQYILQPDLHFLGKGRAPLKADWESTSMGARLESESLFYGQIGNNGAVEKLLIIRTYEIKGGSSVLLPDLDFRNKTLLGSGTQKIAEKEFSYKLLVDQGMIEKTELDLIRKKGLVMSDCYFLKAYSGKLMGFFQKSKSQILYLERIGNGKTGAACVQSVRAEDPVVKDIAARADKYFGKLLGAKDSGKSTPETPVVQKPAAEKPVEKSIEKSDELERKLGTLKNLLDKGLITQEDYNKKKQQLLEGF